MSGAVRPRREITFYTKPGCHLCEEAEELLEGLRSEYDLRVTPIDITSDLAVFERYKFEIPVIVVTGGGTVWGRITAPQLRHVLRQADRPAG